MEAKTFQEVRLCSKCQYILDHWYIRNKAPEGIYTLYTSYRTLGNHHSMPNLSDSARNGCWVCQALLGEFNRHTYKTAADDRDNPPLMEIVATGCDTSS